MPSVRRSAWSAGRSRPPAWVMSNHDFPRLPTRFGPDHVGLAAMLLLTLPGVAFIYQGDEIGQGDGPGHNPPFDRAGRDGARHPMQWEPGVHGGFSDGHPWLEPVDPFDRNVSDSLRDPDSLMWLYRRLIALRRSLGSGARLIDAGEGVVAYERGSDHLVALNFSDVERPAPEHGEVLAATGGGVEGGALAPYGGVVARRV